MRKIGQLIDAGQGKRERAPFSEFAFDANQDLMALKDQTHNRQPDADSTVAPSVGVIDLIKRLEDSTEFVLWDTNSGIGDADFGLTVDPARGDEDSILAEFQGVVDQKLQGDANGL